MKDELLNYATKDIIETVGYQWYNSATIIDACKWKLPLYLISGEFVLHTGGTILSILYICIPYKVTGIGLM